MGKESVDAGDQRSAIADYCRAIETYLCKKNDGHLIRVTGPSFDLVAGWQAQGVPLKIAFAGIDRYVERYYRKGPRRRPVKIDFCDADVLDMFDAWRRAVGISGEARAFQASDAAEISRDPERSAESLALHRENLALHRRGSLPAHLERVVLRLTAARADGTLGDSFDALIDRVSHDLDAARASVRGVRGAARRALIDRLAALDAELIRLARATLDEVTMAALAHEAGEELATFRTAMTPDTFARASEAAIDRLVRERFGLPTVSFTP